MRKSDFRTAKQAKVGQQPKVQTHFQNYRFGLLSDYICSRAELAAVCRWVLNILWDCACITWSYQKLHCCYCWSWTPSLSWTWADVARFCTHESSPSPAGFLHQTRCLANLQEQKQPVNPAHSLVTGSRLCAPVCTREQVFVVTIAVRSGATAGASGSLPLPDCCKHWQLRGADRTLANACSAVASIAVLGWPPRPFGRPGHFLVLLGEENRCPTSHLWS